MSAAWVLAHRGAPATVLEADGTLGGLSKTVEFGDYRFDLGGHRFYTKLPQVERLWREMLGDELLTRSRMSRIYFGERFFNYPLRAEDVVRGLGLVESARCALSYLASRWRRRNEPPRSFEDWVVERFGHRLYNTFFRSYTEKVWGIPGSEIQAEWAAQRIQSFSLFQALLGVLKLRRGHATTVIEEFMYPRRGPGQMWEQFGRRVEERGVNVLLNHRCVGVRHQGGRVTSVEVRQNGDTTEHAVDAVLSSLPLKDLIRFLDPAAPPRWRPPPSDCGTASSAWWR